MGTTSDKLTYLNETKTKIKDNLNFGGANITNETFRQYADKIKDLYVYFMNNGLDVVWNNWEKVIGSGTSITLNQTMEAPIKIDLKGNTEQNGTPTPSSPIEVETTTGRQEIDVTGKNLFNKDSVSLKTYTGATSSTRASSSQVLYLKAGTYKFSTNLDMTTYEYKTDVLALPPQTTSTETYIYNSGWVTSSNPTITLSQDGYFAFLIRKKNNGDLDLNTIKSFQYQLEIGNTASSYEAFKGQSYEINLGKNLAYQNSMTTTSDGYLNVSTGFFAYVKSGETYTLSLNIASSNTSTGYTEVRCITATSGGTNQGTVVAFNRLNGGGQIVRTFTSSYTGYLTFSGSGMLGDSEVFTEIQLEKGNVATTYTPYKPPIYLGKIGTYQDYIYKDNGSWYIHKEIGRVVLNGSESWTLDSANSRFYNIDYINDYMVNQRTNAITNYYRYGDSASDGYFALSSSNNYLFIHFPNSSTNTIALFKTWLESNNVELYYILNTPTTTKITDYELINQLNELEKAKGYDNTTNIIQANDNLPFILDVRALKKI